MNRFQTLFAGLSIAAVAVPAVADAAPWQSVNARQARLDQRIDGGVRSGALTRREATQLRNQLRQLSQREDRYRRSGGLSVAERRDLDRRFDAVSTRVRFDKHDRRGYR